MHYGQHVEDWRAHLALVHETPVHFLKRRCAELGVSYADIIGPRRFRPLIPPRHQLMVEIKVKYDRLTLPRIAKMFNRDHSVLYHALKKHGIKYEPERVAKYRDQIKGMVEAGVSHVEIAKAINMSRQPVSLFIAKQGWTR
jgi:chromosomal replication initiation ATPase DnaA